MKKLHISVIVLAMISLFLYACSSGGEEGSRSEEGGSKGIRVKGLWLGMDLDEAKGQIQKLWMDAGIAVHASDEKKMEVDGSYQLQILKDADDVSVMALAANTDRRLIRFSFHPEAVDVLLGMQGMDNDAIAQKVMKDFNLPELTRDESGKWEYREVEGISIKLLISVSYRYFTVSGWVFD